MCPALSSLRGRSVIPNVFTLRTLSGGDRRVSRGVLERLRMLMDWQLKAAGLDPASVNAACRLADGEV